MRRLGVLEAHNSTVANSRRKPYRLQRVSPDTLHRCLARLDGGILHLAKRGSKGSSDIVSKSPRRPRGRRASTGGNGVLERPRTPAAGDKPTSEKNTGKVAAPTGAAAVGHVGAYSDSEIEESAERRTRRTRRRSSTSRYDGEGAGHLRLRKQGTRGLMLSSSLPSSPLTSDIEGVHSDMEDAGLSQLQKPQAQRGESGLPKTEASQGVDTSPADAATSIANQSQGRVPVKSEEPEAHGNKDSTSKGQPDKAIKDEEDDDGNGDGDGDGGGDEDEEEEEDDGVVRCVCGERNDGELMIQCEVCQVWQHTLCMGIRDEKHIPDKYYCEKCRPDDHPYINSRPRTVVLAEASALGTTTMMRRSAVMAVAKMTAREEYRSASAAAAIAASVAVAATGRTSSSSSSNGGGRRTPKRPVKRPDGASENKSARKSRRSRRQTRGAGDDDEGSGAEYDEGQRSGGASAGAADDSDAGDGDEVSGTKGARNGCASNGEAAGTRKGSSSKRSAVSRGNGADSRNKRRKVGGSGKSTNASASQERTEDEAMTGSGNDEDCGDSPAEDVVARMLGVGSDSGRGKGKARIPKPRDRSASSAAKVGACRLGAAMEDGDFGTAFAGSPRRGNSSMDGRGNVGDKQRGRSEPGSPRSPSPSLQSLLYGAIASRGGNMDMDKLGFSGVNGFAGSERLGKRKRGGGSGRSGKHQRLTVSATNSPCLDEDSRFGTFSTSSQQRKSGLASARGNSPADDSAEGAAKAGDEAGDRAEDDKHDDHAHHRQPKHSFPPVEMEDVDGNAIMVPPNMLNSHGQPVYSSLTAETMCKIRYPHSKASLYELNRRAKQLLEWLGKTQSEYEHERLSWMQPPSRAGADGAPHQGSSLPDPQLPLVDGLPLQIKRALSRPLSEAPTSPINPNDWPTDEDYDGSTVAKEFPGDAENKGEADAKAPTQRKGPRSTVSIMEDLVWRLIRFQETYSS
ncbi:hypothetical protein GQ54DRAFT_307849 [Martensiomyces pterosporus]|nr:hypothetical protein GQ54DRAFT_307849 [Martensiomyces pterosporus]